MRIHLYGLIATLSALILPACTTLLDADFEELQIGQSPDGLLPGDPDGDEAVVQFGEFLASVRGQQPLRGDKSLELQRALLGIEVSPKVLFLPISPDASGRPLFFQWVGRLEDGSSQDDPPLVVVSIVRPDSLDQGSGASLFDRAYLSLEIAPNSVEVVEHPVGFPQLLATSGLAEHTVVIRLSPEDNSYGVTISGEGVVFGGSNSLEGTLGAGTDIDPADLALVIRFHPSGFGEDTYRVDSVLISQRGG